MRLERSAFTAKNRSTLAAKEFLEEVPVYQLKATDTKMAVAKMVLKGFEVRDQAIRVTLGL